MLVTYIDHKQTTQEYREVSGSGKCNSGNTNQDSSAKAGGTTAGPGTVSYHLPSHVDPPQAAVSIPLLRFSCLHGFPFGARVTGNIKVTGKT